MLHVRNLCARFRSAEETTVRQTHLARSEPSEESKKIAVVAQETLRYADDARTERSLVADESREQGGSQIGDHLMLALTPSTGLLESGAARQSPGGGPVSRQGRHQPAQDCTGDRSQRRPLIWPGMTHGDRALPNGWSLKPAGGSRGWATSRSRSPCIPSEPVLAVLHAGYGEHEVVTVNADDGKVIGRVALPETFTGLVWSADGKRLYRRRRVRRRDLSLRPRRGLALEQADSSRHPGCPAESRQGSPAGLAVSTTARRSGSPTSSATRSPGSTRAGGRSARSRWRDSLSLRTGLGRAAQTPLCQPLEQGEVAVSTPKRSRSSAAGRPRSIPTRCCWHAAARSSMWPTPTATPSRSSTPRPARPIETIGTAIDPRRPAGQHAQLAGASRPTNRCFSSPTPTPTTSPSSTSRSPATARRSASSRPAGIPPRSGSPATARRSSSPTARGTREANRDGPEPRSSRRATANDPRVHRRPLPGNALDHPDARRQRRWPPTRRRSTNAVR